MPRLVRRSSQASIRVLEISGGGRLDEYVHRIAFSLDGAFVAACAADGGVAVWPCEEASSPQVAYRHREAALVLAWHPTRPWVATGGQDGRLCLWDAGARRSLVELSVGRGTDWVEHVAFSPDGTALAATAGKVLAVWSVSPTGTLIPLAEVSTHTTTVSALRWMPDGRGIVSACYGGAWLWKIGQDSPVRPFPYDGAVLSIAIHPDGQYLASGNLDGSVHLFRIDTEQNWHMSGYPMKVTQVVFDAHGAQLFTTSGEALVAWNMSKFEGTGGRLFKGHAGWIQAAACHAEHQLVATVGEDGLLCVWKSASTKPLCTHAVPSTRLTAVAWHPQRPWVAIGAHDGILSICAVEGVGGDA
ncbi:MAG: hypothetical protein U0172_00775 [Nitrospiraceae bacterium]